MKLYLEMGGLSVAQVNSGMGSGMDGGAERGKLKCLLTHIETITHMVQSRLMLL